MTSATKTRIILETGSGNDLYGEDYTKAACRAVQDALHHSSIILIRSLDIDHRQMRVQVTIGVQDPDKVDTAMVAAELPRGYAEVTVVRGGLNVDDPDLGTTPMLSQRPLSKYSVEKPGFDLRRGWSIGWELNF